MKALPPALQAHLDGGATTLCWCWRVRRRDGVELGFTDHDRDVAFDGTLFEAASGFTATEIRSSLGLSVDNLEVDSALSAAKIRAEDLKAGRYDDAAVEIWRVNWAEPESRALIRKGSIGERGQRGSEHAMRNPVAAGARVLLLDLAVSQPAIGLSEVGLPLTWRIGPASRDVADDSHSPSAFSTVIPLAR